MKQYQENWLKRLEECEDDDVLSVCREICDDDCGDTDALTMELAKKLLIQLHDKKWTGYTPPENEELNHE